MSDSPVAPPDLWTGIWDACDKLSDEPDVLEFQRLLQAALATERQSHAAQLAEKDATLRSHIDVIKNQGEALRDEVTTRCRAEASLTAARAEIARLTEELEAARRHHHTVWKTHAEAAEASLLALQQQMAKVRAHTSWNRPIDGSGLETLLAGLLESIERIADAALA